MAHLAKGNWTALGYHRRPAVGTPRRGELHVGLPAGLGSDTSCAHRAAGAALHELISAGEAHMLRGAEPPFRVSYGVTLSVAAETPQLLVSELSNTRNVSSAQASKK